MLHNKQSQKYLIGCSYMNDEFNGRNKYTCIEESTANCIWGRNTLNFPASLLQARCLALIKLIYQDAFALFNPA